MPKKSILPAFYVGQYFNSSDDLPIMKIAIISYVRMQNTRILDRKVAGADEWGRIRYSYRFDVGNPLVELWVPDSLFEGFDT